MNDEVKAKLLQYVAKMEAAAGRGADFLAEQAPETVRQFLAWNFCESIAIATMLIAVVVAAIISLRKLIPQSRPQYDHGAACAAASACLILVLTLSSIEAVRQLLTALKIAIAPNVYILETISQLVK